jgi:hypothetical protein
LHLWFAAATVQESAFDGNDRIEAKLDAVHKTLKRLSER